MEAPNPPKLYLLFLDLRESTLDPDSEDKENRSPTSSSSEEEDSPIEDPNDPIDFVPGLITIRSTIETADYLLTLPNIKTIVLLDPTISDPEHADLAAKLVQYARNGGNVVFAGLQWTPAYGNNDRINKIFADLFDVSWRIGRNELPMELHINPAISTILTARQFRWLNWRYLLKGIYITNVDGDDQVFRSQFQDEGVFVPAGCAVACRAFGMGRVNFVGFSEFEESSKPFYQAMCDVL